MLKISRQIGRTDWTVVEEPFDNEDGLCISFYNSSLSAIDPSFSTNNLKRQLVKHVDGLIRTNDIKWLTVGTEKWIIDVNLLYEEFDTIPNYQWLKGKVAIQPEYEESSHLVSRDTRVKHHGTAIRLYLTEREISYMSTMNQNTPIEIQDSLKKFQIDHPDPSKVGFLMMRFGTTTAHDEIVEVIRDVFAKNEISILRADDKEYHDDLYFNILTYIYGASFGVAVFERIESEEFNPNVSLEVGYMLALRKPVCLVKDRTLKTLQTDLVGKLYKTFDPHNVQKSVREPVLQWAVDKSILSR